MKTGFTLCVRLTCDTDWIREGYNPQMSLRQILKLLDCGWRLPSKWTYTDTHLLTYLSVQIHGKLTAIYFPTKTYKGKWSPIETEKIIRVAAGKRATDKEGWMEYWRKKKSKNHWASKKQSMENRRCSDTQPSLSPLQSCSECKLCSASCNQLIFHQRTGNLQVKVTETF